ncbi:hypothetical protein [Streptomyces sp. NBC_01262]|uniref:hypothetical protein n=1 Tax=Streptomyces sp. NBC_01262 TaxID=2903803 RepID=UPI002E2EDB02|nr:hypothetical protein [Streptomyces sp. NBC_01262]
MTKSSALSADPPVLRHPFPTTADVPTGWAPPRRDAYETAVTAAKSGTDLAFTASKLTSGATYVLTAGGTTVATGTASSGGTLTLHATAESTAEVDYRFVRSA